MEIMDIAESDVDIVRDLTDKEIESTEKLSGELANLTVETFKEFKATDWIEVSDKMVNLINSFPKWDDAVIGELEKVFDNARDELGEQASPKEVKELENRMHGWVAEASVRRMIGELGIPMKTSPELDKNGVDGVVVLAEKKESIYVFLSVKSTQKVSPGFHLFNPNEIGYYTGTFTSSTGETMEINQVVSSEKMFQRHQKDGDIHEYCMDDSEKLRKQFLEKNKKNGVTPENHKSYMLVVLAGVGMQPQERDRSYGWAEFMLAIDGDEKKGSQIKNDFREQLLELIDDPEKLEKVE